MFQQPSQGGDKVPFAELVNSLVLIVVREYRTGITTVNGMKDAVAADVHVLDGPKASEVYDNALIFQSVIVGSTKSAAGGEPVLGRVGIGVAKPGQNAPYILAPFTDADAAIAGPYWARLQAAQFQAPAQPVPTPAAATPYPAAASPATASPPAAAAPSPAAAAPALLPVPAAAGQMTPEQYAALDPAVQALLAQLPG